MSNLEKVSDLILLNFAWDCPDCDAIWGVCASCKADSDDAARALADAGLLAPDLPEPQEHGGKLVWPITGRDGWAVSLHDGWIRISDKYGATMDVDTELAYGFARALLAAANYAPETERKTQNER